MRIGIGYDIHRLSPERKIFLGGSEIPSSLGCIAHSDGDVLIHAVIDALLGAAALGDIGTHFPPSDQQYKNISSRKLLEKIHALLAKEGYRIINLDSTIITEEPKLKPHIQHIRRSLASLLELNIDTVSVKAKTNENCDAVGSKHAIAAQAAVLIFRNKDFEEH
ncbi:MAG: 2-C-methyl-D-erythritol 2,4-cyclodiphosphate synthase [Spirochaetia bacterium]